MSVHRVFCRWRSATEAEWLNAEGQVRHGPWSQLAETEAGAQLILIVPGDAVSLHQTTVPGRKRAVWLRAIPYALEDQLADDIEDLHFAFGATLDQGQLPVAVVSHRVLREWLAVCKQHGLIPAAIVPEPLLLPHREGEWSVWLEAQRLIVRTGRWAGFVIERENLSLWLAEPLAEASQTKPLLRIWSNDPDDFLGFTESALAALEQQLESTASAHPLAQYATIYQPSITLNLLQGPYSRHTEWQRWLRPWKATAVLALAAFLLQGALSLYQHRQLQQELAALNLEMERVYKAAVPTATRIVNPKAQLETHWRELRATATASGRSAFFELLSRGGQPLSQFPDLILRSLHYREGQLDWSLEGGTPAVLDQLRQQLDQPPGWLQEMRTTQRDGRMESKITLKKPTP